MTSPQTKTSILIIGGAEDKVHGREILQTFFNHAGSSDAQVAIIPSASREPAIQGDRYQKIFEEMGAKAIRIFDIRERDQSENPELHSFLEDCTGVFLTGGDQLRLYSLLADTTLMDKIRLAARQGKIALAGTSAGAAVMSHNMIAGGGSGESPNRSLVDMTTGLGIVPDIIVDQHFCNRNRMARLLSAVAYYPGCTGIGIDEDTCTLFEAEKRFRVVGKGSVTIVDTSRMSHTNAHEVGATDPLSLFNLKIHVLSHGDSYNLRSHRPIAAPRNPLSKELS
ncbi:MAG: cyanophycinase [Oscillatoriales cyanobacterium RM1_1_9]|nr:cyanophycinase [Oscillatoriales cyanobacterium SM2_3_0]NJO46963.1 cyanophycinase [Oscillatoriales cyanobacterium RM2_1_1]NJO70646.1 cyanophycinase [Oscillatoriales cyanobacterium RM1_1_9]